MLSTLKVCLLSCACHMLLHGELATVGVCLRIGEEGSFPDGIEIAVGAPEALLHATRGSGQRKIGPEDNETLPRYIFLHGGRKQGLPIQLSQTHRVLHSKKLR